MEQRISATINDPVEGHPSQLQHQRSSLTIPANHHPRLHAPDQVDLNHPTAQQVDDAGVISFVPPPSHFIDEQPSAFNLAVVSHRLADLQDDLENVALIEGIAAQTTVSIDAALEAMMACDSIRADRLKMNYRTENALMIGQQRASEPDALMSADQAAAIHLYTQESPVYRELNAALRSRNRNNISAFIPFLKLLLSAVYCLPLHSTHMYRGVKADLSSQYKEGQEFVWWSFTSCTTKVGVLSNTMFLGSTGDRTRFTIDTFSAVDIGHYSAIPAEEERLIMPGTRFRVESVLDLGNGLREIQLVEVIQTVHSIDYVHPMLLNPVYLEGVHCLCVCAVSDLSIYCTVADPSKMGKMTNHEGYGPTDEADDDFAPLLGHLASQEARLQSTQRFAHSDTVHQRLS